MRASDRAKAGFVLRYSGVSLSFASDEPSVISALRHEVVLPGGLVEEAIISEPDYLVIRQDCGEFQLLQGNSASEDYPGQKEVVAAVGSLAHHRIASESEELYIHSGVVAIRGQAILFPGRASVGSPPSSKLWLTPALSIFLTSMQFYRLKILWCARFRGRFG